VPTTTVSVMPAAFRRPGPLPTIPPEVWYRLRETGDTELRDEVVSAYAPLVARVARAMVPQWPAHVSTDDLVGWGCFGLLDAVDRYDPGRGTVFTTYAVQRIRGAIVDGMRGMDWVPRSVRRALADTRVAEGDLTQRLGRMPEPQELAAEMSTAESTVRDIADHAKRAHPPAPISDLVYHYEEWEQPIDLPDPCRPLDEVVVDAADAEMLAAAIRRLSPTHQRVLYAYYWQGFTVHAIGVEFGVTESRVSQLHHQALGRLRAALARQGLGAAGEVRGLRGRANYASPPPMAQSA